MKIKHALSFITEIAARLADEPDYEDELEQQFVYLFNLVNSFKQEDTDPPAAEQMLTRENLEKYGWTVVPQGAWFGVDYDQSYKVDVLALLTDLLDLDVDSVDGYDFVVCGYKKIIHQDEEEEEEEEEDTDPPAAQQVWEEKCAFDWTRKGCIDCDD